MDSAKKSIQNTSDIKSEEQSSSDIPDNATANKDSSHTNDASQLESKILPKLIISINHTKLSDIQSILRWNFLLY